MPRGRSPVKAGAAPEDRFWQSVLMVENCWEWTGNRNSYGYGLMPVDGRAIRAHRWAYEKFRGPIPSGTEIDHLCRNRGCVNPDHLEAVTHQVNLARGIHSKHNALKTHCPHGHEYVAGVVNTRGARICLACHRAQARECQRKRRSKCVC